MSTPTSAIPPARRLAGALEPLAGGAQFAPECHANYAALGFAPSPGKIGRTEVPDRSAYFTSRGSVMGQVPGEVIAAAFAVFNPAEVIADVDPGLEDHRRGDDLGGPPGRRRRPSSGASWGRTRPAAVRIAELLEAAAEPLPLVGRPLFAGHRALPRPDDPLARFWLAADTLREYRGDSHTIAWTAAGFDPIEIGLLGDLYWGLPPRAHTGSRGWSADQLAAGEDRLRSRGLLRR